jgi:beta-lactamase class A
MQAEDRVQGSGVLQYLQAPLDLTLEDVLVLMTIESDNTATNLAIDQVGLSNINARMAAMGLGDTYLYKKVFKPADEPVPSDQKRYGLGKTTPRQMAKLLESIHNCELGDEALCKRVVEILKNQQHRNSIPRFLESAVDASETPSQIANKTGALDADRSDVGIVYTKTGAFVIAAYTFENPDRRWTCDNQGELLIARMAKLIHDAWGRSPKGTPALK